MKLPKIYISDKEYEKNLKEYVNSIGEKGEPLIIPTSTSKKLGKLLLNMLKGSDKE